MSVKVVDASAIACVLLEEPSAGAIERRIEGEFLLAPSLLPFEIANVCIIHARRFPERRNTFRQALDTFHRLAIALRDVNVEGVFDLAERTRLTAYDASYLWLALLLDAELVTLDNQLNRAYLALTRR